MQSTGGATSAAKTQYQRNFDIVMWRTALDLELFSAISSFRCHEELRDGQEQDVEKGCITGNPFIIGMTILRD
jgi:hypothetical protein